MGMPELVVTAVLVEGRSKSEVARDYGASCQPSWSSTPCRWRSGNADRHPEPSTTPTTAPNPDSTGRRNTSLSYQE
jgi:hypothetical protein